MTFNRTKIIATLGPATLNPEMMKNLIEAGVDVFRLNFSHISHEKAKEAIDIIRNYNTINNLNIALLADLQGPKLRVGQIEDNFMVLQKGDVVTISTLECVGKDKYFSVTYPQLVDDVKDGELLLLDDGNITLRVMRKVALTEIEAIVVYGGVLSSNKGLNLPNTKVSLPCLTKKDLVDLDFALKNDIDWVGLSFVRSAADVVELKEIIAKSGVNAKVIAKIEKPEALNEIDEIIKATDAIMVARGDLGVEIEIEKVPLIQKNIVNLCLKYSRPVIIATQMMQSMIDNSGPLRAEVTDVANAVLDGADALMLSGETSVGKYPIKVIEMMVKIISEVENEDLIYHKEIIPENLDDRFISDSICFNACKLASRVGAKALVTLTNSGYTAIKTSSMRPRASVFAFTSNRKLMPILNMVWGVRCYYYDSTISTDQSFEDIILKLKNDKLLRKGDFIVNTASMPIHEMGMTNAMKLTQID